MLALNLLLIALAQGSIDSTPPRPNVAPAMAAVQAAVARAPLDTVSVDPAGPLRPGIGDPRLDRPPLDTPVVRRPRAIEYSDAYYVRLTIHRVASYAMLPVFAAEYALGQNLMQDASPPGWMKPAHGLAAGGVGVLFGVNTITGAWNWWDEREDPNGRTRRTVHSALMLASDAGFLLTAALAPENEHEGFAFTPYPDYQHRQRVHRGVAVGSMALSTVGAVMMWFWKS